MDFMEKWYEEGKEEGRLEGKAELLLVLYKRGKTVAEIADFLDYEVEYVQKLLDIVM